MYFVYQDNAYKQIIVDNTINQEMSFNKNLDGKAWKQWVGFPPWQHLAQVGQSSFLSR